MRSSSSGGSSSNPLASTNVRNTGQIRTASQLVLAALKGNEDFISAHVASGNKSPLIFSPNQTLTRCKTH